MNSNDLKKGVRARLSLYLVIAISYSVMNTCSNQAISILSAWKNNECLSQKDFQCLSALFP